MRTEPQPVPAQPAQTVNAAPIPRHPARLGERYGHWLLALVVFWLALLPRLTSLDAFLTADEDDQIRFAASFLEAVRTQDWARAALLGYPGVPTMAFGALGLWMRFLAHQWGIAPLPGNPADLATALASVHQYPLVYIPAARAAVAVMAALAVLAMYLLLCRLIGTRGALIAGVLLAAEPMFLANSRVLHVDAPLTYFMFLSFLAFWLYLRAGKWGWLFASGVCGALAVLSKTPGVILAPILVATGLIYLLNPGAASPANTENATTRRQRFWLALGIWAGIALVAFFALWPSIWRDPIGAVNLLVDNALIAMRTNHPTSGVFLGDGPGDRSPLYYLVSLPFHLTPLGSFGLLAGLYLTLRGRHRTQSTHLTPLLLSLWAFLILFLIPVSLTGRRGDRYILPLYPPLCLMTAIALEQLTWRRNFGSAQATPQLTPARNTVHAGRIIGGRSLMPRWAERVGAFLSRIRVRAEWVLAGALAAQTVTVLILHPYYFDYFNPLLGGGSVAMRYVNIGWGEGLDQAAAYLNRQPDAAQKTVAAWYSWQFAPFFKGKTVDLSSVEAALRADYVVFYINQLQRGFPSAELLEYFRARRPLHTVWLNGVPYVHIYPGPIVSSLPPPGIQNPADATLGGAVHLMGYDIANGEVYADDPLFITLYWQVLAPIPGDYNVYVRLTDDSGNVFGQVDRLPLGGLLRTDKWQPGTYIRDDYRLRLRPGAPPDVYYLEVAMYSFTTGETFGLARNIGRVEVLPARTFARIEELAIERPLRSELAPGVELLGYRLGAAKLGPGERLPVTLYWHATGRPATDYAVVFEARSVGGRDGGAWTEPLGSELYPTHKWRRGEVLVSLHQLQMPPYARTDTYMLTVRLLDTASGQMVGREIMGKLEFVERPRYFETPQVQYPVGADLDDVAQLIGYDLPQRRVRAGETFPITLYWRALGETRTSYTVFIHVVGPDGVIRGQWDSIPGAGTLPTTGWIKGEVITDRYMVPMAKDAPPWEYTILVGMYDPRTGERLKVKDTTRDAIVLSAVRVE
jgi:4-amino-4-deoxy-L-arabinose transferase-like glycosyltransferase